jgi:hypothetical protein
MHPRLELNKKILIYWSSSFVNISADGAVDGYLGCFFERDTLQLKPITIRVPKSLLAPLERSIKILRAWFRKIIPAAERLSGREFLLVGEVNHWQRSVTHSGLSRRAWVLQEQLLARRALNFTQNEILFECREFQAFETFPSGVPSVYWAHMAISIKSDFAKLQMKPREDINNALRVWWYIVETYTKYCLTYRKGKLIAISGIACGLKECFQSHKCRYLASGTVICPISCFGGPMPNEGFQCAQMFTLHQLGPGSLSSNR